MRAAVWGTVAGYIEYGDTVQIETVDNRIRITNINTFNYLYSRLDRFNAALKGDCIDYIIFSTDKPVCYYPDWFVEAVNNGDIFVEDGVYIFYEESGDIAMSPGSVILKNFMGQLKHMEYDVFTKYYDTLEE